MFNPHILSVTDHRIARRIVGGSHYLFTPHFEIRPDGDTPYLYRWHIVPRNEQANVYFHIQVASDPERPLHDHPWANQSVILSGGYDEIIQAAPPRGKVLTRPVRAGMTIHRQAWEAHRLLLPDGVPYTMTLFSTGPVIRDWGFWIGNRWFKHSDVTRAEDGRSVWTGPRENTDAADR